MAVYRYRLTWRDDLGQVMVTSFWSNTTSNIFGQPNPLVTDLTALSQAALVECRYTQYDAFYATGTSGTSNLLDSAVVRFGTAGGYDVPLVIPSPIASIYAPDTETVLEAQLGPLPADSQVFLTTRGGVSVVRYATGTRKGLPVPPIMRA